MQQRSVQLYLFSVVAVGNAAMLAALVLQPPALSSREVLVACLIACLASMSYLAPIRIAAKRSLVLDGALRVVALLALPPGVAAITVALSVILGNAYLRRPWFNILFNAAQEPLAVLVAGIVYRLLAPVSLADPGYTLRSIAAVVPAGLSLYLVTALLVDGITALQFQRFPFTNWLRTHSPGIVSHVILVAIGAAISTVAVSAPWTLVAAAAPVAVGRTMLRTALGLDASTQRIVEEIAEAIDVRNPAGEGRSQRIAAVAQQLAHACQISADECQRVYLAARLHNVAAALVSEGVAEAVGLLDDAQRQFQQTRAELGARWIMATLKLPGVAEAVRYQDERFGGRTRPGGLSRTDIPLAARIIAVSTAWISLTSAQTYRPALTEDQATLVLRADAGRKWDPMLVGLLTRAGDALPVTAGIPRADRAVA